MSATVHDDARHGAAAGHAPARPVVLATLSVRVDPGAERVAIASALETGAPLVLTNLLRLPLYRTTLILHGPAGATLPHEEDLEAVRATARRAAELGIPTELLRLWSSRPLRALVDVVRERDAALLVIGPDVRRVSRRAFRRALRVAGEVDCLVWVAPDGYT